MRCDPMRRTWIGCVAAVVLLAVTPAPGLAFHPWDEGESIRDVLVAGADLHLSRQGTYTNACGDGYGPPAVSEIAGTWEWEIGSGWTCWNVGGISATGLLAAWERVRDPGYLGGAIAAGDALAARYDAIVTDDPEGAEWEDRPFSQDIEFLVRLGRDSRNHAYARVARDWYRIITGTKTAEENADRYIDARKSLAGWDLASHIRAARAVGEWRYARDMARRLLQRRADWEGVPYGGTDYTMTSYASLLWAFAELGFGGRVIAAAEREFRDLVLQAQAQDGPQKGSWEAGDYQTTAYAVLGLDATDGRHEVAKALGRAFAFLRDTQTAAGGWSYPPEYGEINAEVLVALGGLREWEIAGPLDDPAPGDPRRPAATPVK